MEETTIIARQWWRMPLIPALGRQRQEDFWVPGQPGLHRETLLSRKNKNKQKRNKYYLHIFFQFYIFFVVLFWDTVLCSPGWLWTNFSDSVSQILGL
jgi:dolichol kinase